MSKHTYALMICASSLFATGAYAQTAPVEKPYISVTGTAEREIVPDEIYLKITLTERYEGKEKITMDAQEWTMMQKLKGVGVQMEDLVLSSADEVYRKAKRYKKDVMAKREYELKVSTADLAGKVLDTLEEMKITDASLDRFDYSKKEALKKELEKEAVRNARDKSQSMLEAIGARAGKPIVISENTIYDNNSYSYRANGDTYLKMRRGEEVNTDRNSVPWGRQNELKKIRYTCTINARFLIE